MRRRFDTLDWLVVAATLLAAFLHFYRLLDLPPQAWVDEIWFALRARELLDGAAPRIFYSTFWGGVHPLFVWLTAAAQALGFRDVIVASRAVSAACGVLSVPLAYACFGALWDGPARRPAAALSALALGGLLFPLIASRVGTEPAVALAAGLFCIWQFQLARRTGRWPHWALSGLAAGLSQYLSPHARFILPALAWMALEALREAPPARRRARIAGLAWLGLCALLAGLPLAAFFIREPEWFLGRARAVTAIPRQSGPLFLVDNAWRILLSFSLRGDLGLRHNLPGRPMFDLFQSLGFWAGAAWALRQMRRSRPARELLVWAAVMIVPSLVTDEAPQFERMIGLAAPASALMAVGWLEAWAWARRRLKAGRGLAWAGGALVAASTALSTWAYFGLYPAAPGLAAAMTTTPVVLARELIARANDEAVFVERISEAEDVFAFEFLFPGTAVRRLDFRQCLPLSDGRQARTTYLALSERDPASANWLRYFYPQADVTPLEPELASLMGGATWVEVPAGAPSPAPAQATQALYEPGIRLLGYEWNGPVVKAGEGLFMTLYWRAEAPLAEDLTAFVHVGPEAPFAAQHDGQPCQGLYPTSHWLPGDVVRDGFAILLPPDTPPGEYGLAAGWYRYPSLERLKLAEADEPLPDDRALIARLTVVGP